VKVGDFVELSALGRRANWCASMHNLKGIVTGHRPVAQFWEVSWFRENGKIRMQPMDRKEIKHVRVSKK
jgi:hypothetical protein